MTVPRYQAYATLLIDGRPSRPFSMQTLPPAKRTLDRGGRRSSDGFRGGSMGVWRPMQRDEMTSHMR